MLTIYSYTEGNVTRRIPVKDLNEERIQKLAMDKYRAAVRDGQLLSEYESEKWMMFTEGRGKTGVYFGHKKEKICQMMSDGNYRVFIMNLKTLVLLRFGTCNQKALSIMVKYILEEYAASGFKSCISRPKNTDHGAPLFYMIDFLKTTAWGNKEYIEECDKEYNAICTRNKQERNDRKQPCVMNEFKSYYVLDHIIRDAWLNIMTKEQKNYYFPLVFYWMLTSIIPLRVMEACVIPYDCLHEEDGEHYITVRRTRLKGSTSKDIRIHFYRIDKDYHKEDRPIPKWMYDMVEKWRQETKDYEHPYGLLFSLEYTLSLKSKKKRTVSKENAFDTEDMNQLLKQFYLEFVLGHYNMVLVNEDVLMSRYLNEVDGSYKMYSDEIMMMQLKHTRHLSMINLARWGCNPMLIKNFAGHISPEMDENYYANTTRLIRCATKILWERTRKVKNGIIEEEAVSEPNNMQPFIDKTKPYVETDYGRCYSEAFMNGDYKWCHKCNGDCEKCRHAWKEEREAITKEEEEHINQEMLFITQLLRSDDIEARIEEFNQRVLALEAELQNFTDKVWKELLEREEEQEYEFW